MNLRDLLLILCMAGGVAGLIFGASRRDFGTALLGLIVFVLSLQGLG
jgi:uncharacterized membrane protein